MLRWLILSQAIVYFFIVPLLRSGVELGYQPPILTGVIAIVAFYVGGFVPPLSRSVDNSSVKIETALEPRPWFWAAWLMLAIGYAYTVLNYGLLNRRQGSEYMAELYATLPLPTLAILRGYELLLIPVLTIYIFGASKYRSRERLAVIATSLASLPFMGLADSRGRLLVMAIYLASFVPISRFIVYIYRNWRVIMGGTVVMSTFFVVSIKRAADYGTVEDYLFIELYTRLDGLNLVVKLREASLLSNWGVFDTAMFGPLIAKVPFLEAAQTAKLLGRTSTKQYIIQDLLRSSNLDDSNSMITDPLYFSGVVGVVVAFFALGWAARRFDRFISQDRFLVSFWSTAVALSFATSFAIIENDYIGSIANVGQVLILIVIFLGVCTKRVVALR